MIHLDLNDEEATILSDTLQSYLSNLSYEIADTDLQEFRDKLKEKRTVLEKIHKSLAPAK